MNPATPIVHVVDDDESFRLAVGRLLRASGYRVQTYPSGSDFFNSGSTHGPGCLLLDVKMPGSDGLELQTALTDGELSLPIIFISGRSNIPIAVRALKAGAVDFLTKPVRRQLLLHAVNQAIAQDAARRSRHEELAGLRSCYASLSPREHDVFSQVITGKLNKQIAAELGASERTIKAHRAHIMEKMQVKSVAELVHIANRLLTAEGCLACEAGSK
jgi:FixJ family two-component response regulator